MPRVFGNAGREHMALYGSTPEHFAKIGEKDHRYSVKSPHSQFRDKYTLDEVKDPCVIYEPLAKLHCSPASDGAACAVLMSEEAAEQYGLQVKLPKSLPI